MMSNFFKSKFKLLIGFISILLITFQNCSQSGKFMSTVEDYSLSAEQLSYCADHTNEKVCLDGPVPFCVFNGAIVEEGASVVGYLQASVPPGNQCTSEERVCTGGRLLGSSTFSDCSVEVYPSCSLAGQIIKHGDPIPAFSVESVAAGSACPAAVIRQCDKGILSGSGDYTKCTVRPAYVPPPPPPPPPVVSCQQKGYANTRWDFVNGGLFTWSPTRSTNPSTIPGTYGTGWLATAYEWGGVIYDTWWCPY